MHCFNTAIDSFKTENDHTVDDYFDMAAFLGGRIDTVDCCINTAVFSRLVACCFNTAIDRFNTAIDRIITAIDLIITAIDLIKTENKNHTDSAL